MKIEDMIDKEKIKINELEINGQTYKNVTIMTGEYCPKDGCTDFGIYCNANEEEVNNCSNQGIFIYDEHFHLIGVVFVENDEIYMDYENHINDMVERILNNITEDELFEGASDSKKFSELINKEIKEFGEEYRERLYKELHQIFIQDGIYLRQLGYIPDE